MFAITLSDIFNIVGHLLIGIGFIAIIMTIKPSKKKNEEDK